MLERDTFRRKTIRVKTKLFGDKSETANKRTIYTHSKVNDFVKQDLIRMLKRALKTDDDLNGFYELSQKDNILKGVVKDLCGMHTIGWPELFPALILAVSFQMAPMKRSNQMMNLIIANFGDEASFDGKTIRYWPSPHTISNATVEELMIKAKLGSVPI